MANPCPVIFLHLQKTGGTTVDKLLRDSLSDRPFVPKDRTGRISCPLDLQDSFVLSGHITARQLPKSTRRVFLTTVLREPTERLISHYYFLKSYTEAHLETYNDAFLMKVRRTPFNDLIHDRAFIERYSDFYLRKLDPAYEDHEPRSAASLERAAAFLDRCNLVGITSRFESYVNQLMDGLGVAKVDRIPNLNARSSITTLSGFELPEREPLELEAFSAVEEILKRDRLLYNYAVGIAA